jgi:hypothetical protein
MIKIVIIILLIKRLGRIKDYIPKDKKIWAPFYCDGKQKEYFEEMGFDIIHEDKDFFSYTPNMIL